MRWTIERKQAPLLVIPTKASHGCAEVERRPMKPAPALLHLLSLCVLACCLPLAAQDKPKTDQEIKEEGKKESTLNAAGGAVLPEVVILATRTERSAADVPATTTVLDKDANVFSLATSMRDYARYEPNVSVPYGVGGNGPGRNSRAGNSSINIRGMDGNRVLMTVDGIRQPDVFSFGGSYNVGRDYVDVDSLKQVEILKNAASSLYGSDAIGGVVNFTTLDPSDLMATLGKSTAVRLTTRYDSADDSWSNTLAAAQSLGQVEYLLLYTRRDGSQIDNRGTVQPDPSNYNVNNALAKMVWKPSARHRFELAAEHLERSSDNDLVSSRRNPTPTTITRSLLLNDDLSRTRFSLEHQFDASGLGLMFDRLQWNVYYQTSSSLEHLVEDRDVTAPPSDRLRVSNYSYRQDHLGLNVNFTKDFDTGSLHHTLSYGTELVTSFSRRVRDGLEYNLTAGTVTNNFSLAAYPIKDMPDSRTSRAGFYLQDEIAWGADRRYRLTPGLRFEYYGVDTTSDPLYLAASVGRAPQDYHQFALAPKLAFLTKLDEEHTAYFQYANGFRNPTPEDLNGSITNTINQYQTIANPGLRKETSHSFELGLRRQGKKSSWSTAAFYNYYQNFIQTFSQVAAGPPIVYQSTNLSSAEVWGFEAKGDTTLGFLSESLDNFGLFGNAAYTQGNDLQNHQPLNSIDPFKMVAGLRYRRDTWQVELISTYYARMARTPATATGQFQTPSAITLDLVARWQVSKNVMLTAGLYNLTNQKYWLYQTVRGTGPGGVTSPGSLDRFTQPGISTRIALTLNF